MIWMGTETSPPCRVCNSAQSVGVWDPAQPERTVCVECCGGAVHHDGELGHQFEYERLEGHMCRYCGSRDLPRDWGDE